MYGKAEAVAGELLAESNAHTKTFIATKVWTRGREAGIAQMQNSFKLLKTDKIDLMQTGRFICPHCASGRKLGASATSASRTTRPGLC